jgi:hypothetical protein
MLLYTVTPMLLYIITPMLLYTVTQCPSCVKVTEAEHCLMSMLHLLQKNYLLTKPVVLTVFVDQFLRVYTHTHIPIYIYIYIYIYI